jgi:hypothetical protein
MPGSTEALALDLLVPGNGLADDVLNRIRIENAGSATAADLTAIVLRRDDGDGTLDAGECSGCSLRFGG